MGTLVIDLLLSTHSHDACYNNNNNNICLKSNIQTSSVDCAPPSGGESDVPACGPPASFSVHLASSAVTPAGSVHKSRGDNVVRMWVQLKR